MGKKAADDIHNFKAKIIKFPTEQEKMIKNDDEIMPLIIIRDRYGGAYSGAKYTAWNVFFNEFPSEPIGEDPECMHFWKNGGYKAYPVGRGNTIEEAYEDLKKVIKLIEDKING